MPKHQSMPKSKKKLRNAPETKTKMNQSLTSILNWNIMTFATNKYRRITSKK